MKSFNLNGKTALITGAAGLLGREHAAALLELECNVILTDVNERLLDEAKGDLEKGIKGSRIDILQMDVTNERSVQDALKFIKSRYGKLDVLINNAAIDPKVELGGTVLDMSRLENFSLDSWNIQVAVGLTGAMICCKHLGAAMAESGGGVILNVASDLSVIAPNQSIYKKEDRIESNQPVKPVTYSVIKHGLHGLTKYVSTYWADKGVRINSLSPGGVYNNQPDEFVEKLSALIPFGRMANKDEYRGCIQFLCSDASSYMTGQNLVVDGGRTVW